MKRIFALLCILLFVGVPFTSAAELVKKEEYDEQDTGASIAVNVRSYEPTILTSNLIQENTVPVYAYLSGLTVGSVLGIESSLEPLYGNIQIEKMRVEALDIETNDFLEGEPKWFQPNKFEQDNLGYLRINLKQFDPDNFEICSTDSDCDSGFVCETGACYPKEINLSLSAEIWFKNAERLYSLSKSALILPIDADESIWTGKLNTYGSMYGFYGGRGLVRVRDISSNTVDLTVYSNKDLYFPFTGAPRALADISLKEGETSDYIDLGSTDESILGSAKFRVTVNDIRDPVQERAVVSVIAGGSSSQVVVVEGSSLYPGSSWTVGSISYGQGRSGYEYSLQVKSAKGNVETLRSTEGEFDSEESAFLNKKFYAQTSKVDLDENEVFFYDTGTKSILSQSFSSLKSTFTAYGIDLDISEIEGDIVQTNALTLSDGYPLKEVLHTLLSAGYYYKVVDADKNQIQILHYSSKDPCANAEVYEDAGVEELHFADADVQKNNDVKRGVLCGAIREFQSVVDEFDDEILPSGSSAVDESYFMLGQSYDAFASISGLSEEERRGAEEKALTAYKYLVDSESKIESAGIAKERTLTLQNTLLSGRSSVGVSLDDNGQFVYAELLSVSQLAREDGSSALLSKDGVSQEYYLGDALFPTLSDGKNSYNWYVSSISEGSVLVKKKYSKDTKTSTKSISSLSSEIIEGSTFSLKSVNLRKEAYLTITPGTGGSLRSKNNFSIHIPIEYRGLNLNPDKLDDRIERAKALKETIDRIYISLEKIVRTWNKVCYIVWAGLTVKNSFLDQTDAALRHDVIHGVDNKGGWQEYCQENSGYGEKYDYDTYDACMLAHAKEIETGIESAEAAQEYADNLDADSYDDELQDLLAGYGESYEECVKYVGDDAFLDEKSKKDLLYTLQLGENLEGSVSEDDPFAESVVDQVESYGGYEGSADLQAKQEACKEAVDAAGYTTAGAGEDEEELEDRKELVARSVFESTYIGELRKAQESGTKISTEVPEIPGSNEFSALDNEHLGENFVMSVGFAYGSDKSNKKYIVYTTDGAVDVEKLTYGQYETILENRRDVLDADKDDTVDAPDNNDIFQKIKDDIKLLGSEGYISKKSQYLSAENGQQFYYTSGHIYVADDAYISGESNEEYASDAKIEIYASGEYTGMPYCLPHKNGNFIKFLSYTNRNDINVIQYWNVGPDGHLCSSDDILLEHESQLHYQTANPSYNSLVTFANPFVKKEYIEGQQISIKGISSPSTFKVSFGKSRIVQEGATASCYDVMDPGDCRLLFNTCDPVMCPPSRFNFGGRWQVSDVIQSGIVGSVVLPQGSGDAVPVCFTGVLASLSFAKTLLDGYVECLEAAKYEGETVGICDKLYSLYWCELAVREGAAILDNNKDGVLDLLSNKVYERKDSGGGEFLQGVKNGFENSANSYSYFTTEYAQSGLAAFKGRSLESVGTTLCKQALYAETPFFADFMQQITTPEDPSQFYATLTIKPYAPSQGTAAYQTYYHVYAGNNLNIEHVVYQVYLKNSLTGEIFYTTENCEGVSATLELGGSADETVDCLAPEGLDTVCVVMNGETNCGFGAVSTSFGLNFLKDSIVADEVMRDIRSEKECYPSVSTASPTAGSLALPYSYGVLSTGVQRVCALQDPGLGQSGGGDWAAVGTCGEDKEGRNLGNCWLNTESFSLQDAKHSEQANEYLSQINWEQRKTLYDLDESDLKSEEESLALYQKYADEMGSYSGSGACVNYVKKIEEFRNLYEQTLSYTYAAASVYQIGRIYYALATADGNLKDCGLQGTEEISHVAYLDGRDLGTVERIPAEDIKEGVFEVTLDGLESTDIVEIKMYPDLDDYPSSSCDDIIDSKTTCATYIQFTSEDDTTVTISVRSQGADEARFSKKFVFYAGDAATQGSFEDIEDLCGRCGVEDTVFLSFFNKCELEECHNQDTNGCYFQTERINECLSCRDLGNEGSLGSTEKYDTGEERCAALNGDKEQCEKSSCYSQFLDDEEKCDYDNEKDVCEGPSDSKGSSSGDESTPRSSEALSGSSVSSRDLATLMRHISDNSLRIVENRGCLCGDDCEDYAEWISNSAEQYNIDPLLLLSIMMQESSCSPDVQEQSSGSGCAGLMQICSWEVCQDSLHINSKEDLAGENAAEDNIACGALILSDYYERYNDGVSFDGCSERGLTYTGWEAAVRAYNGLGCDEDIPEQDYYVDEAVERYNELLSLAVEQNLFFEGAVILVDTEYMNVWASELYLDASAAAALDKAAMELYNNNRIKLIVTSAGRTLEDQAELFYDNCLVNGEYRCDPATCDITDGDYKDIIKDYDISRDKDLIIQKLAERGSLSNCPHTSLVAVDVWCDDGGTDYQHDPNCQNDLTELMVDKGFCRLSSEAWHFELNAEKVSSSCTTEESIIYRDNGDDPTLDGCTLWDYSSHECVG